MDKIDQNLGKLKDNIENIEVTTVAQSSFLPQTKERDESLEKEFLALSKEYSIAKITASNLRLEKELCSAKLTNSESEISTWTERLAKMKATAKHYEKKIAEKQKELQKAVFDHERRMKSLANTLRSAPSAYEHENLQSEIMILEDKVAKMKQKREAIEVNNEILKTEFNSQEKLKQSSLLGDSRTSLEEIISSCKMEEELRSILQEEKDLKNKFQFNE